jgi:hypothetical protein
VHLVCSWENLSVNWVGWRGEGHKRQGRGVSLRAGTRGEVFGIEST